MSLLTQCLIYRCLLIVLFRGNISTIESRCKIFSAKISDRRNLDFSLREGWGKGQYRRNNISNELNQSSHRNVALPCTKKWETDNKQSKNRQAKRRTKLFLGIERKVKGKNGRPHLPKVFGKSVDPPPKT